MEHRAGAATNKAPAQNVTGDVFLNLIAQPAEPSRLVAAHVRFTPGARTNWHSHALGQTLYVLEGEGFVVTRGGDVANVRAGDTVRCPPGEEHWHGGTAETLMAHVALTEGPGDGTDGTTWLEPVFDEQYRAAHDGV